MFLQSAQMDNDLLLIDSMFGRSHAVKRAPHFAFNKTECLVDHLLFLNCMREKKKSFHVAN